MGSTALVKWGCEQPRKYLKQNNISILSNICILIDNFLFLSEIRIYYQLNTLHFDKKIAESCEKDVLKLVTLADTQIMDGFWTFVL